MNALLALGSLFIGAALAWPSAQAQTAPYKVGVLTSSSGPLAPVGQQVKWGFELAAREINAAGGIRGRPVQIIEEDDESNPTVAARKAEKLLQQDKVDFITGMIHSGGSLAVSQIAERAQKLAATTVSYSSNITGAQCSPYMFRTSAHAGIQAAALTAWMAKNVPGKRYALVTPDYEMGRDAGASFEAGIRRGGGEVVGRINPPLGAKDFSTYFAELRSSRPDVLLTMTPGTDTIRLLTQMKDAGLIGPRLSLGGAAGAVSRGNIDALQGAAEQFMTAASYAPDIDNPLNRKFAADFQAAYKVAPDLFAADSYSLFFLIKAAADKAGGTETEALRAAMRGLAWDTPSGRRVMRADDQQAALDMFVIRVQGKDFVVVDKVAAATITIADDCKRF